MVIGKPATGSTDWTATGNKLVDAANVAQGGLPVFNVEDYGAVGNGTTDDYAAVLAAWNAMLASSTGGFVFFPRAVEYRVDASVGGRMAVDADGSYAIFRLPKLAPSDAITKKTYGLLGVGAPYSPRQYPNEGGTGIASQTMTSSVLKVDYSTPFTWSSTNGLPSVIGAPDADKSTVIPNIFSFTNLHFVADKITMRQPNNPSLCDMNLETCSTATIGEIAFDCSVALDQVAEPTHPTAAALLLPRLNNNVTAVVDKILVVGRYAGAPYTEHLDLRSAIVLRTKIAVPFRRQAAHMGHITCICIEQCPWGFAGYDPSAVGPNLGVTDIPIGGCVLKADFVDFEDTNYLGTVPWMYAPGVGAHVWDPTNKLRGQMVAARNDVEGAGVVDTMWVGGGANFSIFGLINFNINGSTRLNASTHIPDNPPNAPTIGTATAAVESASVTFTPAGSGGTAASYRVISTPGSVTATGTSSPITILGLTAGTGYTFTVRAQNTAGNSAESSASNSVTPTAPSGPPNTPTIGVATAGNTTASVAFTPAGSGQVASSFRAISTPGSFTATGNSSPLAVTGLTNGTSYTFTVRGQNSVGNSAESSASNSVTPFAPATLAADTFTRANQSGLGTAETGGAWTVGTTGWSITSNKAVESTAGSGAWNPAWVAAGNTNVDVQASFLFDTSIDMGLVARVTDGDNLLFLDLSNGSSGEIVGNLFRRVSGSFTAIGTLFTVGGLSTGTTYTARLVCVGTTITAYLNGSQVCVGTDATQSGTGAGIARLNGGSSATFDNFTVGTA